MHFPIAIELHRSRFLSSLLALLHVLAAVCLIALPWPWPFRGVLLVFVGLSLWRCLRASRIVGLRISGKDKLEGVHPDGHRDLLTVLSDSTVFSHLIVLRLHIGDHRRTCNLPLLPDQMTVEQYRLLRLWLRWHSETKPPAVASV